MHFLALSSLGILREMSITGMTALRSLAGTGRLQDVSEQFAESTDGCDWSVAAEGCLDDEDMSEHFCLTPFMRTPRTG